MPANQRTNFQSNTPCFTDLKQTHSFVFRTVCNVLYFKHLCEVKYKTGHKERINIKEDTSTCFHLHFDSLL